MLNPPDTQFCSAAQTQTVAQSKNVILDYAYRSFEAEGYLFIRLCLADEKQDLCFPWRELDERKWAVR
jgi:hypothetical protein